MQDAHRVAQDELGLKIGFRPGVVGSVRRDQVVEVEAERRETVVRRVAGALQVLVLHLPVFGDLEEEHVEAAAGCPVDRYVGRCDRDGDRLFHPCLEEGPEGSAGSGEDREVAHLSTTVGPGTASPPRWHRTGRCSAPARVGRRSLGERTSISTGRCGPPHPVVGVSIQSPPFDRRRRASESATGRREPCPRGSTRAGPRRLLRARRRLSSRAPVAGCGPSSSLDRRSADPDRCVCPLLVGRPGPGTTAAVRAPPGPPVPRVADTGRPVIGLDLSARAPRLASRWRSILGVAGFADRSVRWRPVPVRSRSAIGRSVAGLRRAPTGNPPSRGRRSDMGPLPRWRGVPRRDAGTRASASPSRATWIRKSLNRRPTSGIVEEIR